jgi:hypothetical protein
MFKDPIALYHVVKRAWTEETCCSGWSADNPCRNQCSVTALAVQRLLGGDIVKTRTKGGTHFYNSIDGVYWDLAADQFSEPIPYENLASDTAEALGDTTPDKLRILLANIEREAALAPA